MQVSFNLIDHSGERTATHVNVEDIESDGSNMATVLASISALQVALLLATDCNHVSTTFTMTTDTSIATPPATVTAQREIAVRVKMVDNVNNKPTSFTVAGPATTFYPPTGVPGDYIPLDNAIFAALITVLEANLTSPDGNPVTVVEGRLIGRNS
jgi:hypothetical protein